MPNLEKCLNIDDLRAAARRRAHKMVFDYIDGGADDEASMHNNRAAFAKRDLSYKVLAGGEKIDTSVTLLGERLRVPFFCAPAAGNRLFHTQGELAVAKAASDLGTVYALSTLSTVPMEEVARHTQGPKWFQLYVWKDKALVKEMLARAKASGFKALILTVDLPVTGNRERDPRNGLTVPPSYGLRQLYDAICAPCWTWDFITGPKIQYSNLDAKASAVSLSQFVEEQLCAGFTWADAEWILNEWNGPSLIKGIVRADDARQAVTVGFDGAMISNHGGRQLDHAIAPIDALPEIADQVGQDLELIVDGGIRRGTDILKALALGAKAVSFARPYLYGLAAAGEKGVQRALTILADAVERDMALLGVRSVADIDRSFVRARR